MKKQSLLFFLLLCWLVLSAQEESSIYKMWSRAAGNKNYAFDIDRDTLSISFSEKDKWTASNRIFYAIVSAKEKNGNGRIICNRDSMGIVQFRRLDFFGLNEDSVKIFLFTENFDDEKQANAAPSAELKEASTYYTTSYLYYKKIEEKTTVLRKTDYINFLKDAQTEAKKRLASKALDMDAKKPIDKRVQEFLFTLAKEKQYKGKIFPGILEKAIKNYEKDEAVKKLYAGLKSSFVVKKETTGGPQEKDKKPVSDKPSKSKATSSEVEIKTVEHK